MNNIPSQKADCIGFDWIHRPAGQGISAGSESGSQFLYRPWSNLWHFD